MTSELKVNVIKKASGSTITIGESGDTVSLATGANQSGFGRSGSVDWQTSSIKTANFTAENGKGYFVDTTSGAITVTLPSSPSAGNIVAVADYGQTADTNNITIARNSSKINGTTDDMTISNDNSAITLVYVDATQGWKGVATNALDDIAQQPGYIAATGGTITECGNFKIHTFNSPGTFTVTCAGNAMGATTVSYVVVGAGGGGGKDRAGGGGAGGFRESRASTDSYTASPLNATSGPTYNLPVSAQGYPITVGAGGTGGNTPPNANNGGNGGTSSFSTITSAGGGGGHTSNVTPYAGNAGGSGGGGGGSVSGTGGAGNTPPVSPPQGNNGGTGQDGPNSRGAGGGGAGAAGANASTSPSSATAGGAGVASEITGSSVTRAGGGGATGSPPITTAPGGSGGGGAGGNPAGTAGTANTGGGGGGSHSANGATGGSGVVIIRYKFQQLIKIVYMIRS